jgi:hypothetical protein
MNLDSLSLTLSQISHIVTNLTKKNYKSSQIEISSVCIYIFLISAIKEYNLNRLFCLVN